jgi:hypothetical protein
LAPLGVHFDGGRKRTEGMKENWFGIGGRVLENRKSKLDGKELHFPQITNQSNNSSYRESGFHW